MNAGGGCASCAGEGTSTVEASVHLSGFDSVHWDNGKLSHQTAGNDVVTHYHGKIPDNQRDLRGNDMSSQRHSVLRITNGCSLRCWRGVTCGTSDIHDHGFTVIVPNPAHDPTTLDDWIGAEGLVSLGALRHRPTCSGLETLKSLRKVPPEGYSFQATPVYSPSRPPEISQ